MAEQSTHGKAAGHRPAKRSNRETARMVASAILGAVITAFALVNLDEVEVNWLIGSADTPLIIVIALSFVLGVVADRLFAARSRRREARRRS